MRKPAVVLRSMIQATDSQIFNRLREAKEHRKEKAILQKMVAKGDGVWRNVKHVNLVEGEYYIVRRKFGGYRKSLGFSDAVVYRWQDGWKRTGCGNLPDDHSVDGQLQVFVQNCTK